MEQDNYEFLSRSLTNLGFGEVLNNSLKTKMELGFDKFDLKAQAKFGKDTMQFAPQFARGEESDYYFLNRVMGTLTKENGETLTASFPLFKQRGFNMKEMYNLIQGRPVYRIYKDDSGEKIGRWSKLDFSSTDDDGNPRLRSYYDNTTRFNLAKEVGKLPVLYANNQEKEELMQDLRNGDRVTISIRQNGKMEQAHIEVAPQIGGLILYNSNMDVIKRTNTQVVEAMEENQTALKKTNQLSEVKEEEKVSEKLPEATKQLMDKINNSEGARQAPAQRQRKAS